MSIYKLRLRSIISRLVLLSITRNLPVGAPTQESEVPELEPLEVVKEKPSLEM